MTLDQVMATIRANVARGVAAGQGLRAPDRTEHTRRAEADLGALATAADLLEAPMSSSRPLGPAIQRARRVLVRLLGPVLARQSGYNAINARLVAGLRQDLDRVTAKVASLAAALDAHERRLSARDDEH